MPNARTLRLLLGLAAVLPAAWGAYAAARLLLALWPVASAGDDPLAARLSAVVGPETEGREAVIERAVDAAPRSYRAAWDYAEGRWLEAAGGARSETELLEARSDFLEAARRAPSYAPPRFRLHGISVNLGELDRADEEALETLQLAPLVKQNRATLAEYFRSRYLRTRSEQHLRRLVRVLGRDAAAVLTALKDFPVLDFEHVRLALEECGMTPVEALGLFEETGRWGWAFRVAAEADPTGRRTATVHLRLAKSLLDRRNPDSAWAQVREAFGILGDEFTEWTLLGRARLAGGDVDGALAAFRKALAAGGDPWAVAEGLRGEVPPATREDFWTAAPADGPAAAVARLEIARATADAGRTADAHALYGALADDPVAGGEACYLLARLLDADGKQAMALMYAEKAVSRDPTNGRYQRLARSLRGKRP